MASLPLILLHIVGRLLLAVLGQRFVGSDGSQSLDPIELSPQGSLSDSCKYGIRISDDGIKLTSRRSTFETNVTCHRALPSIALHGHFPTIDELAALCTSDCLQSLDSLRISQDKLCANDLVTESGVLYPATFIVNTLIWTYNYTCHRDPTSGAFCAPIFDRWGDGDAPDQNCSECVLGTYQIQLGHTWGYDKDLFAQFSSLTSSCHATGYPVTSPPPITISRTTSSTSTTTTARPQKVCSSKYTIKEGDDCHSISKAQRVSTNNLLYLNNLEGSCTHFPGPGTTLCMPPTCEIYTVEKNDSCYDISRTFNRKFTVSQLISWNIDISRNCDNIEMLVGKQICVSFPGDLPGDLPATTSQPVTTPAPIPTNIVEGTNTNCSMYYEVIAGDNCASIAQISSITLADFYFLNPEVNSTSCNNLLLGYSYCVRALGDISTYPGYAGLTTDPCVGGTTTGPASCYVTTYITLPPWDFPSIPPESPDPTTTSVTSYTTPPVVKTTTSSTRVPNYTLDPHQTGLVDGCIDFYKVRQGDTCNDIAQRLGVALSDIYLWNPALKGDCTGLLAGYWICQKVRSTPPTTPTTTTTSLKIETPTTTTVDGGVLPPGPTQAGIPAGCNKWIAQKSGVYCYDMAAAAGISLNCLYQLNPALNTSAGECVGLWAGYAYCVGTVSHICK
ncbi:LysM domain-containing protein [Nannizzia gypsea CBS 118893]|uniref:LysM domain-containing protein n=1 Tax=Arthroderma gypseum (strain ATCC MYA-4604 / CBS 118893) TaxID=535722 RepID=E5R1R4_ARTGP|nr:LysM domain-containing protein [Nannizzia gypsea CBS 118893]EFQ98548.1 LysM domain-containing protein [Nannizzia gypsea CBS 118893]